MIGKMMKSSILISKILLDIIFFYYIIENFLHCYLKYIILYI